MRFKESYNILFVLFVLLVTYFSPSLAKKLDLPSQDVLSEKVFITSAPTPIPLQNGQVTKVVDGDTIDVYLDGKTVKIRIIGINSPETVDPRRPVECFGNEASQFAKSLLTGKIVVLEADESQANIDRYSRLLRYVYLPDKTDFGLQMIKNGYAYEYTYDLPYKKQLEYKNAQTDAANKKLGLWGNNACN